jgi:membrane protein YdbS with pleckstrin-like domain
MSTSPSTTIASTASPTAAPAPATRSLAVGLDDPPGQECDLAYIPFAGRSQLGGFVLCAAITLLVGFLFWEFHEQLLDLRLRWLLWLGAGVLGAVWLVQLVRWAYRQSCFYVRLTTRRILYHRGVLYQWCLDVPLREVARATVRRSPLERFLGVGNIELYRDGERKPLVVLTGIRAPESVAKQIRQIAGRGGEQV